MTEARDRIAEAILDLLKTRGDGKSICPSEAARRVQPDDWRSLMPEVRTVAARLAEQGRIAVTQRGAEVDIATVCGPIRLILADKNTSG